MTDDTSKRNALIWIGVFAVLKLVLHTYINQQYGFHRDELATLDDARHLAFGYVAYPPFTPFIGRIALSLFGESLAGFRFFAAAAQSVAIVLTAASAKALGGGRTAQWIAAVGMAISGVSLSASSLFQYVAFDFLWWVLIAFLVIKLIANEDKRFWVAIGAAIGVGFLTKYTIFFFVAGIAVGFLATPLRKHFFSPWLWAGVAIAGVIATPNIYWQIENNFVSLDFLRSIHERDVAIGRTDNFLLNQLFVPANPVTIPFWLTGLFALFLSPSLRRFRIIAWMAVVPMVLFTIARGRDYYASPLYPMLIAAGAVWMIGKLNARPAVKRWTMAVVSVVFLIFGGIAASIVTPIAPIGSDWWRRSLAANGDFREEFGWPELAVETARVWESIPVDERKRTAIFCGNYGEAGAINLYGPKYGLPAAISPINSFWARGYGEEPPDTLIVLGVRREKLEERFESVIPAGTIPNPLNIENEEAGHPEIFICRGLRGSWPDIWPKIRSFG